MNIQFCTDTTVYSFTDLASQIARLTNGTVCPNCTTSILYETARSAWKAKDNQSNYVDKWDMIQQLKQMAQTAEYEEFLFIEAITQLFFWVEESLVAVMLAK